MKILQFVFLCSIFFIFTSCKDLSFSDAESSSLEEKPSQEISNKNKKTF